MLLIGNGRLITRSNINPYLENGAVVLEGDAVKETGSLFAIKDMCAELGMRACLCYEVSGRDGEGKCRQSIQENADFAKWAKEQDSDMIKAMFGGHALFTIWDKTFAHAAA